MRPERSELLALIRKLESIAVLDVEERLALLELPLRLVFFDDNQDVVREGDALNECCLVVRGFVCRYKILGQGQRQIFSFHIPGDLPDLQSLHLKVMDHSVASLEPSTLAFIPHAPLHALIRDFPNIAAAFWRDALIDAAIFREWLAGVGRRSAFTRIAHLICEIYTKALAVGLADNGAFEMPVTQAEVGDALGLSTVHVNRVLKELRSQGMIHWKGKVISVLDWDALSRAGDFAPNYLHLRAPAGGPG